MGEGRGTKEIKVVIAVCCQTRRYIYCNFPSHSECLSAAFQRSLSLSPWTTTHLFSKTAKRTDRWIVFNDLSSNTQTRTASWKKLFVPLLCCSSNAFTTLVFSNTRLAEYIRNTFFIFFYSSILIPSPPLFILLLFFWASDFFFVRNIVKDEGAGWMEKSTFCGWVQWKMMNESWNCGGL